MPDLWGSYLFRFPFYHYIGSIRRNDGECLSIHATLHYAARVYLVIYRRHAIRARVGEFTDILRASIREIINSGNGDVARLRSEFIPTPTWPRREKRLVISDLSDMVGLLFFPSRLYLYHISIASPFSDISFAERFCSIDWNSWAHRYIEKTVFINYKLSKSWSSTTFLSLFSLEMQY